MINREKEERKTKNLTPKEKAALIKAKKARKRLGIYVLFLMSVFALVLLVTIISAITAVISSISKPEQQVINLDDPEYAGISDTVITEEITDGQDVILDSNETVPPVVINPNEKINLSLYENYAIPKPFDYDYEFYKDFKTDNPIFADDGKKIIVIDPGHQDSSKTVDVWLSPYLDPAKSSSWVKNHLVKIGSKGVSTKKLEYETTHKVAEKLKTELEARGYTVILTKDAVSTMLMGAERAAVANKNNADLMISLHCDGYSNSSIRGAHTLIPAVWDGYPNKQLAYISSRAAGIILDEYVKSTGLTNRGSAEVKNTSMFSFCKTPIFLLEMGYLSNADEDKLLNSTDFQVKIAEGISNGIDRYFASISTD